MFRLHMQPYMDADDAIGGGSDDFSDVVIEDAQEEVIETETEETEETESVGETKPTETVAESPKVKLKYNHEEKEYSLDDVVPLAQKGLNYDKLQEKLNEIQSNPALSKFGKVQEVSSLLGYQNEDELIEALYNTHYENEAKTQGLTPAQIRKDHELSQKERALSEKEQSAAQQQQQNKMYADFATNFPDVKAEMIKPETWEKVNNGMDLSTAYTMQQNQDLMNELKIFKQNAENSKKAPVGSVSAHGSDMKTEKIFEGFDD
jgi:hypothetical protein